MRLRHRKTKHGVATDLDFYCNGRRYRPCLGYNLNPADEIVEAGKMVEQIKTGTVQASPESASAGLTLADFTANYLAELKERGVVDLVRPGQALDTHLIPHFTRPMRQITYKDGQAYIAKRRAEGAADGTIRREWSVALSILTFAAEVGEVSVNPLTGVTPPKDRARTRMPTTEEFAQIAAVSTERLRRAATLAMNCGLREEKIWALHPSWIRHKSDGPWLEMPAPRTTKKGHPLLLPLNRFAYAAFTASDRPHPDERIFSEWSNPHALSKAWARAAETAGVKDLRFHDLRRYFASTLDDLGAEDEEEAVRRETVKYLLGHQPSDTLERHYLVKSKGWARKLRKAVEQLAGRYEQFLAEAQVPVQPHPMKPL